MKRNPQVLIQIERAEDILVRTGVSDHCSACINSPENGCCQRCPSLGLFGCVEKPMACALWLCHRAKRMFPDAVKQLGQIADQLPAEVAYGHRHRSLIAEQQME